MKNEKIEYIPGVCNIGPAEIRMRRWSGIVGLVVTVITWGVFFVFNTPAAWRLVIFLPATVAAVGFLQAQLHFCVNFGMRGLFNVSDTMEKQESVDQKDYRRKDQRKAIIIITGSAAIGAVVAVLAYFIS